jgi:hypothetical protein
MALSVLYTFPLRWRVVQNKMGGAFMNSFEYRDRINALLTKLEKDMPQADRLMILDEIRELLSAFFVN